MLLAVGDRDGEPVSQGRDSAEKGHDVIDLECIPYGVGHGEEGLCLLMRMGPYRILLDCGLQDLSSLIAHAGRRPPADVVLCSHAHPDHARGLLAFHEAYPQIPIYASEVTSQLLSLNWLDRPSVPSFCQALPWRSPVEFREGLSAELWPAGHLPGAASFLLTYTSGRRTYTLFFTGDFFLSNSRLVEGLPLEELRGLKPDVLIIEGSYGTARHPHRRQQENQLAERIHQAIATKQSVLLPTPVLGLGQELLMLLRSHHHFTGRDMTIWVEDTVAAGCDAYLDLLPHFPSSVQNFARHQPLFWDERIRPRVRRLPPNLDEETAATLLEQPCIVLAAYSSDLSQILQAVSGPWSIFVAQKPNYVGSTRPTAIEERLLDFQSDTSAAYLRAQLQSDRLTLETYLLTDHCDGPSTTQLIHNLRPQHVIFVHGAPPYLADLTGLEELQNRYHLHLPSLETAVELPIGETFLQPAAPETTYGGELTEGKGAIIIALSSEITADPRWSNFADTGVVEARWQGDELILRGLSQQELLRSSTLPEIAPEIDCCEHCVHYRGQSCWNQASPLFGFKVTPEGYCPVFERSPEFQAEPSRSESRTSSSDKRGTSNWDLSIEDSEE